MMLEMGFCSGIENYSRHLSGREEGSTPHTLIDYFPDDFLMIVDESHVTIPQVRGMYEGDRSRKTTLVEYGFRLPSAMDNRPLKFEEFEQKINQMLFVSATPNKYEKEHSQNTVEQIIRPTGLLDPEISVRPVKNQIDNLIGEINKTVEKNEKVLVTTLTKKMIIRPTGLLDPEISVRPVKNQIDNLIGEINKTVEKNEKVLVTTLTKKMSEDLTSYLKETGIRVRYLHSDIDTLERLEIIRDLRLDVFDVLIGINLLREGLDIPEVSLVAIIDADKEGFLRSETSLIQTIGRAARNANGRVIMYADKITDSMQNAISETNRRRNIQEEYNEKHNITPKTIIKKVHEIIKATESVAPKKKGKTLEKDPESMSNKELLKLIEEKEKQMRKFATDLMFEQASILRDEIIELKKLSLR